MKHRGTIKEINERYEELQMMDVFDKLDELTFGLTKKQIVSMITYLDITLQEREFVEKELN